MLRTFFAREQGQGLVEYSLIILLIAIAVIAAVTLFGQKVLAAYNLVVGSWPP
ncbi:MAG TPA: hypothetical protein VGD69_04595 [Herpetosiphonaceae bacterium]